MCLPRFQHVCFSKTVTAQGLAAVSTRSAALFSRPEGHLFGDVWGSGDRKAGWVPSGNLRQLLKMPFIVSFPVKNGDLL